MNKRRQLIVEWDGIHDVWRCDLHDIAHTVLIHWDKQRIERVLDDLELHGRLEHVGVITEEAAEHPHWK